MLTKMRMSVDQAREHFLNICSEVYSDPELSPKERTARLRNCVEHMLSSLDLPVNLKMTQANPKGSHSCAG
jgi:hypothetical protein